MLETSRLMLVPLRHEHLQLLKNDPRALAPQLGYKYQERQNDPEVANDLEEALTFWLTNTHAFAHRYEWYTNWEIILKSESVSIGGIGFAGFPTPEGRSMVGYGLDVRYHGKGYATEALRALVHWGFSEPRLKTIVAETPLNRVQSQSVLLKNGFSEEKRDQTLVYWQLCRSGYKPTAA